MKPGPTLQCGPTSLLCRFSDTNVCWTGSVKILKSRHKISVYIRHFYSVPPVPCYPLASQFEYMPRCWTKLRLMSITLSLYTYLCSKWHRAHYMKTRHQPQNRKCIQRTATQTEGDQTSAVGRPNKNWKFGEVWRRGSTLLYFTYLLLGGITGITWAKSAGILRSASLTAAGAVVKYDEELVIHKSAESRDRDVVISWSVISLLTHGCRLTVCSSISN